MLHWERMWLPFKGRNETGFLASISWKISQWIWDKKSGWSTNKTSRGIFGQCHKKQCSWANLWRITLYSQYKKQLDLIDLPPTSHSITHGHIHRWWFLVRKLKTLLKDSDGDDLDPTDHGWTSVDGHLLPEKCLFLVPDHLSKTCGCKHDDEKKRCGSNRCTCKKLNVGCTSFCECTAACANSLK